jgi:hypothetical protein
MKRRSDEGFLLLDALIAAAIVATGLVVLVNLMPKLMEVSEKRRITTVMTGYALAVQQQMLADSYVNIVGSNSGTFENLLGATFPSVGSYRWRYTSSDSVVGVMKSVNLVVENTSVGASTDTFSFVVADMNDEVASPGP